MQRPSGVYEWQMPSPVELPIPLPLPLRVAPELAQEASYLAASAKISSFCCTVNEAMAPSILSEEEAKYSFSPSQMQSAQAMVLVSVTMLFAGMAT